MSQKYQREIEEILRQVGDPAPSSRHQRNYSLRRMIWIYVVQSLSGRIWSLSPGRVMLIAISLLLSALMVGAVIPGLGSPIAWAALLLFIIGYGWIFAKPPKIEKRWRGQLLEEKRGPWWSHLRRKTR